MCEITALCIRTVMFRERADYDLGNGGGTAAAMDQMIDADRPALQFADTLPGVDSLVLSGAHRASERAVSSTSTFRRRDPGEPRPKDKAAGAGASKPQPGRGRAATLERGPLVTSDAIEKLSFQIRQTITQILSSDASKKCFTIELEKARLKHITWLARALRTFRRERPGQRPNMIWVAQTVAHACRKIRSPASIDAEHMSDVTQYCASSILQLMLKMKSQNSLKILASVEKSRLLIVSLLYLMRNGIHKDGYMVLPKLPILFNILPLEIYLPQMFGIPAKSITEGENIIKWELRQPPTK